MAEAQQGILAAVPPLARHLFFTIVPETDPCASLRALCDLADGDRTVVGLGKSLVLAAGREIDGLRTFPHHAGAGFDVPSTPMALWCWLRGDDRGDLVHRTRSIERAVSAGFRLTQATDTFRYGPGLDLTGYEDGTENPTGPAAVAAAVVSGCGPGLDGASFAAVQRWVHDLNKFESMAPAEQDDAIGRRKRDNVELDDAPPSAHVKRTAQESFDPKAFILRRSMPWADAHGAGLMFLAFGKSFDAFEVQLRRMVGGEDGVSDALFKFTRPVSGGFFWCPPLKSGRLDLGALGL